MIVYSELLRLNYYSEKVIPIINIKQATMYMKHGLMPVDIFVSGDQLVFMFSRKDSKELYQKWQNHELN